MLLPTELPRKLLSLASLPPSPEQIDLFGIDPEDSKRLPRKSRYIGLLRPAVQAALAEVAEAKETKEETSAEIFDWLTLNAEFELHGELGQSAEIKLPQMEGDEFSDDQLMKLMHLLKHKGASHEKKREALDWMVGGVLTWDHAQVTQLSFVRACLLNELDPRSLSELILRRCVSEAIVPMYARIHLAARQWFQHLPSKECSREEKRARLRWLFAPLLAEKEIAISPLLPEHRRSHATNVFNAICDKHDANPQLTGRLVWYHCVRWHIVRFNAHALLAAED